MELGHFAGLRRMRPFQPIWGCSVRCLWGMQVARLLALYSRQPVKMDLQNMTTARAIHRRWRATSRICNRASPLSRSRPSTCSLKPPRSKSSRISDPCSGRQGAAVCNRRLFWERAIWKSPLLGYSARNATTGSSSVARRAGKRHARTAANAKTTAVPPSKIGLCADV